MQIGSTLPDLDGPCPPCRPVQRLIAAFSPGCNQVVGGPTDLPAGGQEEDLMAWV